MVPQPVFKNVQPTEEQQAIIAGKLMADATLQKRSSGNCRIKIEQSVNQRPYVLWLHEKLASFCVDIAPPQVQERKLGNVFYFWTGGTFKALNEWHRLFYQPVNTIGKNGETKVQYVKTITPELLAALPTHPLFLTCLFLDDGSVRNDAYSGKLAMHNFSKAEQLLFKDYLLETYGLEVNVVRHTVKSGQYYISIPASTFPKLVAIIEPWVRQVPTMEYKLNEWRREFSKNP